MDSDDEICHKMEVADLICLQQSELLKSIMRKKVRKEEKNLSDAVRVVV